MKHELLVPAGNMDCLYQAVYNGCDALYIAGKNYGARKFASNFSNDEIIEAIKFCHLYGVKIYVTMNTLIKNDEVDDFINQVRFLYKNGVDALIMQDFGMICLVRKLFPDLEIHASTQANNSSVDTCKLFYDLGVKRVVFSRELSIDEIDSIDVPIEKEAFIHGALCVSYSGCCLMSSMLGGRSGNRGECAGCCRMPFSLLDGDKLIEKDKYLLSMKELNTTREIKRLLSSSIYSFKIEGRMKSPLYVGFVTRLYRRLIDGESFDLEEETRKLKTIFNREFTKGHLFFQSGSNLINKNSPNHIGLKIGNSSIYKDKIKLELENGFSLNQFDSIRFLNNNLGMTVNYLYDKKMNLCSSASGVCYVDNKIDYSGSDFLMKTKDYLLEKEYNLSCPRNKIKIDFKVVAKVGDKLMIEVSDSEYKFVEYGDIVSEAINAPSDYNMIYKHLSKLGDTPFELNSLDAILDDNIFIQVKIINDIRRKLVNKLCFARSNRDISYKENNFIYEKDLRNLDTSTISCFVFNEEQLKACLDTNVNRIYVNNKNLYDKYSKYSNVYYVNGRCNLNYNDLSDNSFVSDIFEFGDLNVVGNYTMNVTNIYTAYFLKELGLKKVCLSVELSDIEIMKFIKLYYEKFGYNSFEVLVYGKVENMIIKDNILDLDTNNFKYRLRDSKNRIFNVYYDGRCSHIYNYQEVNCQVDDNSLSYRLDFYDEDYNTVKNVVNKIRELKSIY